MKNFLNLTFLFFAICSFKNSETLIQSGAISLKQLLSFENLSNGQIQDILILNDWDFVSTENSEVFRMKTKKIKYKSSDKNSSLIITEGESQRKRDIHLETKSSLLYKQLIKELNENGFVIAEDEIVGGTINTPKVGEYYLLDHLGKVYSKGSSKVYCAIAVYAKVTNITSGKINYDGNSKYSLYEIAVQ